MEIWDGRNTVGGNKIYVSWRGKGVLLDFGMNFSAMSGFFTEFLRERPIRGIFDFWRLNIIPHFRIYRKDLIPKDLDAEYRGSRRRKVCAVLLSHAHLDHSGAIPLLSEKIPVVATAETAVILKAMDEASQSGYLANGSLLIKRRRRNEYVLEAGRRKALGVRKQFLFGIGEHHLDFLSRIPGRANLDVPKSIADLGDFDDLEVEVAPVDHSIPGSAGFIIHGDVTVAYSGDIRFHGKRGKDSWKFVQRAREAHVLIVEGTRIRSEGENVTEEEVYERIRRDMDEEDGLVVADFPTRNLDRLNTFHEAAKRAGRELVLFPRDAYLLVALGSALARKIRILKRYEVNIPRWERDLYEELHDSLVTHQDIRNNPGGFVLRASLWEMPHVLDIGLRGGTFIYSSSEAHNEEEILDFGRLMNWLNVLRLKARGIRLKGKRPAFTKGYHASGHASRDDLIEMIDEIEPDVLIPVHTENPGEFSKICENTMLDKTIEI